MMPLTVPVKLSQGRMRVLRTLTSQPPCKGPLCRVTTGLQDGRYPSKKTKRMHGGGAIHIQFAGFFLLEFPEIKMVSNISCFLPHLK